MIDRLALEFGSQCVVVAIDARRSLEVESGFEVFTHGGRRGTGLDAVSWAAIAEDLGAGEILQTSMDRDGTKGGFDLEMLQVIGEVISVPMIASGGVGLLEHLVEGVKQGGADAVLAASIFHFGEHSLAEAKRYLTQSGVSVRPLIDHLGPIES